jgi:hypothetical protein
MSSLNFQDFSTVQSESQPTPKRIGAATATITPTTFLTVMTAGVAVATIVPPVTGCHMLALMFADNAGVTNTGNISAVVASVALRPMLLIYDPVSGNYFPVTVA